MPLHLMKAAGLALAAALLAIASVSAAPPSVPFSPYGTVKVNSANISAGVVISALCGGQSFRQTVTAIHNGESWYSNLDIPGDDPDTPSLKEGCAINETITFRIGDLTASQTTPWTPGGGRLDLTATGAMPSQTHTFLPLLVR